MKIFFLHLHFHEKSKSSNWFIENLRINNEVHVIPINAQIDICFDIIINPPDLVICWQTEYLVPWFLSRSIAAIAIPMADGCQNMPLCYYKKTGQLGSISVSDYIYSRYIEAALSSFYIKYYPEINSEFDIKHSHDRDIDIFFSFRSSIWTYSLNIFNFLSRHFTESHIHDARDGLTECSNIQFDSHYFDDISSLDSLLKRTQFYLCPRHTEGIGLSVIRALQHGCIPIGVNQPGNCEYFNSNKLGVAVDYSGFLKNPHELLYTMKKMDKEKTREHINQAMMAGRIKYNERLSSIQCYLEDRVDVFLSERKQFINANIIYRSFSPKNCIYSFYPAKLIKRLIKRA